MPRIHQTLAILVLAQFVATGCLDVVELSERAPRLDDSSDERHLGRKRIEVEIPYDPHVFRRCPRCEIFTSKSALRRFVHFPRLGVRQLGGSMPSIYQRQKERGLPRSSRAVEKQDSLTTTFCLRDIVRLEPLWSRITFCISAVAVASNRLLHLGEALLDLVQDPPLLIGELSRLQNARVQIGVFN